MAEEKGLMRASDWIERFDLQPHPEGGWYRELHRSEQRVTRISDGGRREGLTMIVFLLQAGEVSRWHRVLAADEVWHHGAGAPLDLRRLPPEGGSVELLPLGPYQDEPARQSPIQVVPAGWWQAARSLGAWSLMHCLVGPGFDFADFQLLADLPSDQHPTGVDVNLI